MSPRRHGDARIFHETTEKIRVQGIFTPDLEKAMGAIVPNLDIQKQVRYHKTTDRSVGRCL